jgi:propanol-preferring alcohol dehydrogenase
MYVYKAWCAHRTVQYLVGLADFTAVMIQYFLHIRPRKKTAAIMQNTMMRAHRWHGGGLVLQDIAVPKPSAGEVVIKIQACGICHSDYHFLNGQGADWAKKRSIALGREISGEVTTLGPRVSSVTLGDRVAVALPPPAAVIGLDYDSGFAQYTVVPAEYLVSIPNGVSFEQAAVSTGTVATAYHAIVMEGEVTASKTVGIIGLGGLGMLGVSIAVLQGATVYGFDIDNNKFGTAIKNGATACFSNLEESKHITFDVIVDFVGMNATMTAAIKLVRRGGYVVLVGLGAKELNLETFSIVFNNIQIRGCLGGSKEDIAVVLDLIATKKLNPALEEVSFDKVEEAIHRLGEGNVNDRLYTRPNAS